AQNTEDGPGHGTSRAGEEGQGAAGLPGRARGGQEEEPVPRRAQAPGEGPRRAGDGAARVSVESRRPAGVILAGGSTAPAETLCRPGEIRLSGTQRFRGYLTCRRDTNGCHHP